MEEIKNNFSEDVSERKSDIEKDIGNSDYFIGLDIGTDSVGWAVSDTEYRLIKSCGRPMWGSYLFDAANTAKDRRVYRSSRRRIARVRGRLDLLQSLFDEEIYKVDSTFFLRLNDSSLTADDKDKRITTECILFGDRGYTDKQYFAQYPTIYHLRKSLMETPAADIRLLYLACHNIIKNRGNFLYEGQRFNFGGTEIIKYALKQIEEYLINDSENSEEDEVPCLCMDDEKIRTIAQILSGSANKSDKQKSLTGVFGALKKDKRVVAIIKLVTGGTCSASALYGIETEEFKQINMETLDEDSFNKIKDLADDACLLDSVKALYDWSKLVKILGNARFLSYARVKEYEMHKADLALLKKYVKTHCPDKYKKLFRRDKDHPDLANYASYIGMDKHKSYKKSSKADFYKFLEKEIFVGGKEGFKRFVEEECDGMSEYNGTAYSRYENGTFLPKQITSDNGVIPYQLHLAELEIILKNAAVNFPFLNNVDDSGLSVSDKIISLLTFRIPYYVGPLGGGKFSWAKRFDGYDRTKVTPWNFDLIVDKDASEEEFIKRMTNKCTYIRTEDVLPANSILYSNAVFLNELNNLKINGNKDARAIDLVYEYALQHKKISNRAILKILAVNGYDMNDISAQSISGIDGNIRSSMSSYIDFKNILGDLADSHIDMCEEIIKWKTLMSDKERIEKRIRNKYGNLLSEDQIKAIRGLNYSGWGRLSNKVLCEILSAKAVGKDGMPRNVLSVLREEKINLTEALTATRWGFSAAIDAYNRDTGGSDTESINDLYCSPSVKRAVRRTVAIVNEIIKIKGYAPRKIMVEMARGGTEEQKGKRTNSRKQQLIDLYRSVKDDARAFLTEIESKEDRDFASKKLFAYYMQKGKCLYTGEQIDLEKLLGNNNEYDFDHIYPRSKINDDSFDNRVLVKKTVNARKKDEYPLPAEIRNRMYGFWSQLKAQGFISERKFLKLTRTTPLSVDELADFENAQLVATRQSTKIVADLLKNKFPKSEIIYTKANKTADFKDRFDEYAARSGCDKKYAVKLVKVRELNNLHHAKDAYINIVVGNVFNAEYGFDARMFYRNKAVEEVKSDFALFRNSVKDAWIPKRDIPTVADTYYKDNCSVVRFVSEGSGALFNATIKTAGANDNLIPLKSKGKISNTKKYGGYDSASTAYFALVKSAKKGAALLSLEAIPIMIDKLRNANGHIVEEYLTDKCGLESPQILIPKIRLNTLFTYNGSAVYIRGKTGKQLIWCNASELHLDRTRTDYLKKVVSFNKKYAEAKKFKKTLYADEAFDGIKLEDNIDLYDAFTEKLGEKIYSGITMCKQRENLVYCRAQFIRMSPEIQCEVLVKILAYFNCNSVLLDLSDFCDSEGKPMGKNYGMILSNKLISSVDMKMISRSPTGHYKNVIDFAKFKE